MSKTHHVALVAGATGIVGSELVKHCVSRIGR